MGEPSWMILWMLLPSMGEEVCGVSFACPSSCPPASRRARGGPSLMVTLVTPGLCVEFKGMDIVKHGESAYPAQAWVEFQYSKGAKAGGKGPTNPVMGANAEITGVTTIDGDKKNIDGEVF